MSPMPTTVNGLQALACISALQKCIRRGLEREAMQFACELGHTSKAFASMVSNRLQIISHEDIGLANPDAIVLVRTCCDQAKEWYDPDRLGKWRLAIGNAIRLLCRSPKSREADHFQAAVGLAALIESKVPQIPDFAFDQHTVRGRQMGRGLDYFRAESTKLVPTPAELDPYEDEAYRLWAKKQVLEKAGGKVQPVKRELRTKPEKGGACKCWASPRGGWSLIQKVNKVSVTVLDNWGNGGRDFTRTIPFDKLAAIMSKSDVDAARAAGLLAGETKLGFALLTEPPKPARPKPEEPAEAAAFEAMADSLKAGIQVVAAEQLFPTPVELAAQVVQLADIRPDQRVLEPSAGTGALLRAIPHDDRSFVQAVEIDTRLAAMIRDAGIADDVRCADFLACNGDLGTFDRIVMNPPFANGADIKHILHAAEMLAPGGRLVAICANGPRQREKLMGLADQWIDLPAGSFAQAGTNVNAAIVVIDR